MDCLGQWFSNISWQRSLSKGHNITVSKSNLIKSESFRKLFISTFILSLNQKPNVLHLIAKSFLWHYLVAWNNVSSYILSVCIFLKAISTLKYCLKSSDQLIFKMMNKQNEMDIQVRYFADILINLILNCPTNVTVHFNSLCENQDITMRQCLK